MKNSVDMQATEVEIAAMRKTKAGDMRLEVKGDRAATKAVTEAIQAKIPVAKVRATRGEKTVQIRDLDATVTEEEIRQALSRELKVAKEEVTVKSLKTAYGENKVATVALQDEGALKLVKQGRVKIGWIRCRVREYVDVRRCYRCWTAGHDAKRCDGPDRSKLCLRCGKEGHRAKNCQGTKFCFLCNRQGHRSDTGSCPLQRKALTQAWEKIGRRRGQSPYSRSTSTGAGQPTIC